MHSLVLVALMTWAQGGAMTLAEIDAEALVNNSEIRSLSQQSRQAESRVGSAAAVDDPQFGYRAWGTPILEPWNLNQTQHMFMFTQNVPGRGKRELKYLIASDDAEIQALFVEAKKREVIGQVHRAFYRLLRTYDQIRLHHDQVALAEQVINATRIQYTAGKIPQKDVLQAGLAYTRLTEHLIMFEREADSSRAELNALMGREPDEPLEIQGEYAIVDQLPSQEQLLAVALRNRPELLALEVMQKQRTRKVQLAEKGRNPDYTISAGYMLMPSGSMNRNGLLAEFSMSLPWLNRSKHDSEVLQAQEESAGIVAEYQRQRAAISREIREAAIRAESARKIVDLYRTILRPDIQNLAKAATVAYQTNQAELLSILDTQSTSIDAEYAVFDALTEYEQSIADLERAIGAPLSERKPL
jgi:cobalt-zinc-cadmium efflux system outer membrane protein